MTRQELQEVIDDAIALVETRGFVVCGALKRSYSGSKWWALEAQPKIVFLYQELFCPEGHLKNDKYFGITCQPENTDYRVTSLLLFEQYLLSSGEYKDL